MSIFLCLKMVNDERSDSVNFVNLKNWGLEDETIREWQAYLPTENLLARIIEVQKGKSKVITEKGSYWSTVSGRYRMNIKWMMQLCRQLETG